MSSSSTSILSVTQPHCHSPVGQSSTESTMTEEELILMDAWWRAANYLTVGQIYLQDNALVREPLKMEHIKPRLLGHWGTSPGLSLLYVHLNRLIKQKNLNAIYLAGPGHGGPAILANVYLEGVYTEVYPEISEDDAGIKQFFRQFSTPGGVPSHVSPPTPGSIHEGGELGYVLSHAFGAAMDNPDLLVLAVVGDGEAETGPLEGSWKGITFLNPVHDGAVLPVLHLNGYKIAGPTVLGRESDENVRSLLSGHGYDVHFVEGDDPMIVHRLMASTMEVCVNKIQAIQKEARTTGIVTSRPRWPCIVMRTPKGWTGPRSVDNIIVEGTFRSHQVPLSGVKGDQSHLDILEKWLHSYKPETLFDKNGKFLPEFRALSPAGNLRMGANPIANGGLLTKDLTIPDFAKYGLDVDVNKRGFLRAPSTQQMGLMCRDLYVNNKDNFRVFCPDETNSNKLGAVFEVEKRCFVGTTYAADDHISPFGRVMEVLSEHNCHGWLEGYLLTGRHGLFATYEAFALIVASMTTQHAKWLEACLELPWRAAIPSLNILLTSTCWRNDHNGFSHQGPGFMDTLLTKQGSVVRVYLPCDANTLVSVSDHCFRSKNYINLIIIDKQPQLQYMTIEEAKVHCAIGASVWKWAGNEVDPNVAPDVILGCAGDIPTQETLAAADFLRSRVPGLIVRVVNVVDLMSVFHPSVHPHGMAPEKFAELFTESHDAHVIMAFHGYPGAMHLVLHRRPQPGRFHVHGYNESGTTTTPFDMVVMNGMSRFHLAKDALTRVKRHLPGMAETILECDAILAEHHTYVRKHLEDIKEINDWTWGQYQNQVKK